MSVVDFFRIETRVNRTVITPRSPFIVGLRLKRFFHVSSSSVIRRPVVAERFCYLCMIGLKGRGRPFSSNCYARCRA